MAVARGRGRRVRNAGRGEAGVLRGRVGATKAEVVDVAGPRSKPTRGSCSGSCPGSIPTRHRASDSSFVALRAVPRHQADGATPPPRCWGTWTREREGEVKRLSVDAFATVGAEGARASGVNDGEGKEGGEYPLVVPRGARLVRALLNDQHAVKCATEWMKVWGVEEYILFDVLGYGRHALASAISAVCPDASADGFAIA
ncbi:hypothetical protein B0H13DRAFT_1891870 [Mycena leptocephala]|nr:hypothetical protein B0H13DRAFT_1891870 [Mycena leptocephala]